MKRERPLKQLMSFDAYNYNLIYKLTTCNGGLHVMRVVVAAGCLCSPETVVADRFGEERQCDTRHLGQPHQSSEGDRASDESEQKRFGERRKPTLARDVIDEIKHHDLHCD